VSNFATVVTSSFLLPQQVISILGFVLFSFALLCKSDTRRAGCHSLGLPALLLVNEMVGRDKVVRVIIVALAKGIFKFLGELMVSLTVTLVDEHSGKVIWMTRSEGSASVQQGACRMGDQDGVVLLVCQ
jgi:hypothetical protein